VPWTFASGLVSRISYHIALQWFLSQPGFLVRSLFAIIDCAFSHRSKVPYTSMNLHNCEWDGIHNIKTSQIVRWKSALNITSAWSHICWFCMDIPSWTWTWTWTWWLMTDDWWLMTNDWWLMTNDWWLVTDDW
jgi:hypothetical protein